MSDPSARRSLRSQPPGRPSARKGSAGRALSDAPRVECRTRAQWRAWLTAHHADHGPIWLVFDKKSIASGDLDYDAIVEEALCFGWIDSLPGAVDARRTRIYLAPRKPGSVWSALNKARVERLAAAGLLAPAGLAKIGAARRDGSWDRLNAVAAVDMGQLPEDLTRALRAAGAAEAFDAFPRGVRRQSVQWIVTAVRAATRAERVRIVAAMSARGLRPSDPAARRKFVDPA